MVSPTTLAPVVFWRNQRFRLALYQAVALLLVIGVGAYFLSNVVANSE